MNNSDYNNTFTFNGPIEMAMEPDSALEGKIKIAMTVLLTVIFVLSVVGNICTCAVISRDRTMRTPTNLYLFNLAIADLSMTLFIPMEIYTMLGHNHYPLGEIGCRTHMLVLYWVGNVSTLTICVFTVERYLVVTKPFLRPSLAKISRVSKVVVVIWIVSLATILPEASTADILVQKKYVYCYITLSFTVRIVAWLHVVFVFITPMILIFVLYMIIAMKFDELKLRNRGNHLRGMQNKEKAVRMLAAVAISFFFCWSPILLMRLMMLLPEYDAEEYFYLWRIVNYLSLANGYLSATVNPILYGVMSSRFRNAFKKMFRDIYTRSTTEASMTTPYS